MIAMNQESEYMKKSGGGVEQAQGPFLMIRSPFGHGVGTKSMIFLSSRFIAD